MEYQIPPPSVIRLLMLYNVVIMMVRRDIARHQLPVSVEQLIILMHIKDHESISQQDIAKLTRKNKSSIHRLVGILKEKGLLEISLNKNDKRLHVLTLTVKGVQICEVFNDQANAPFPGGDHFSPHRPADKK
ncbi:hypothetical protein GCM10007423_08330 [Dyadobacter endophyticus]|uniref:HTH marR-type domain-containing protein n=1 Tax=Dyadobacter endophyticus TaxID=1749036 RepID=A0ABQ1YGR0_9BACT|nr:helix-turn-helix domain-containing protein [Dyadobacter endophyticus]GGH24681.1 hypothetical protein GCM10007423_08330 [Dyadobacter endophyticus]